MLLMVQSIAQNMPLYCGALFAGGSVYTSPVEDPVNGARGTELAGAYLLTAHPRPVIFQSVFGMLAIMHAAISLASLAALFTFILHT